MNTTWVIAMLAISTTTTIARDLVALRRFHARRTSIKQLAGLPGCVRVIDHDRDGTVVDVTLDHETVPQRPQWLANTWSGE